MRERILDVALELFGERGYDATSLREIAERLGVSKAALYYHFEQKADILVALHLRLHELGEDLLKRFDGRSEAIEPVQLWLELLDQFIDAVIANRELILLHQRNMPAMRRVLVGTGENHAANDDLDDRMRSIMSDPRIPLHQRIRIGCAIGAVTTTLLDIEGYFAGVSLEARASEARKVAREILSH